MYIKVIIAVCLVSRVVSYHFKPGIIVQRDKDILLYDKSVEQTIDISAIFLGESNIDSIHENIVQIQKGLEEIKNIYFTPNSEIPDKSLQHSYNVSHYGFKTIYEKVINTKTIVNNMRQWALPHEIDQKRNPIFLAVLGGFGLLSLLSSIGISIAGLVESKANSRVIQKVEKQDAMIDAFLHKNVQKTNEIIKEINNITHVLVDVSKLEILNTQLLLIDSKLDTIQNSLYNFESDTKDYIEAITLATKGILSPRLLPVKELTKLIRRAHQTWRWTPIADYANLDKYYSFINVEILKGNIVISIPFNIIETAKSYVINPFPTPANNKLVISNITKHIVKTTIHQAEIGIDTLRACKVIFDKLLCPARQFIFVKDNCTHLLNEGNDSGKRVGHCNYPLTYYRGPSFIFQLVNKTRIMVVQEEKGIHCEEGGRNFKTGIYQLQEACTIKNEELRSYGTYRSTEERRYPRIKIEGTNYEKEPVPIQVNFQHLQELDDESIMSSIPETRNIVATIIIASVTSGTSLLIFLVARRCVKKKSKSVGVKLEKATGAVEESPEVITPGTWHITAV